MLTDQIKVRNYRGVDVFIGGTEKTPLFVAKIGAQRFSAPSFESLTKKLDPAIGFEARELVCDNGKSVEIVRVIGSTGSFRFLREDSAPARYETYFELSAKPLLEERRQLSTELDALRQNYQVKIDKINNDLNALIVRPADQ